MLTNDSDQCADLPGFHLVDFSIRNTNMPDAILVESRFM